MKRILLIPQYSSSGGTRTYFFQLIKFYFKQGYYITIAIKDEQYDAEVQNMLKEYNFNVIFINKYKKIKKCSRLVNIILKMSFELVQIIKLKIKVKYDLLVLSNSSHSDFIISFFIPGRVLYVLHTIPENKEKNFLRSILSKLVNENKKIITVSKASKMKIEKFLLDGRTNKNVDVVGNYYNYESNIKKNRESSNMVKILTLGHVIQYKNPNFFIEVANKITKKYKNVEFIWAGNGPDLEKCINYINKNKIRNVKFIGNSSKVNELYEEADIYCQFSKLESQGISLLGAMANSLPCIGTNVGGIPEVIEDGVTGYLVEDEDKNKALELIELLIRDNNKRKILGKLGYRKYNKQHSEKIWEKKMKKIYNEILYTGEMK